jgi:hypothetical protein
MFQFNPQIPKEKPGGFDKEYSRSEAYKTLSNRE